MTIQKTHPRQSFTAYIPKEISSSILSFLPPNQIASHSILFELLGLEMDSLSLLERAIVFQNGQERRSEIQHLFDHEVTKYLNLPSIKPHLKKTSLQKIKDQITECENRQKSAIENLAPVAYGGLSYTTSCMGYSKFLSTLLKCDSFFKDLPPFYDQDKKVAYATSPLYDLLDKSFTKTIQYKNEQTSSLFFESGCFHLLKCSQAFFHASDAMKLKIIEKMSQTDQLRKVESEFLEQMVSTLAANKKFKELTAALDQVGFIGFRVQKINKFLTLIFKGFFDLPRSQEEKTEFYTFLTSLFDTKVVTHLQEDSILKLLCLFISNDPWSIKLPFALLSSCNESEFKYLADISAVFNQKSPVKKQELELAFLKASSTLSEKELREITQSSKFSKISAEVLKLGFDLIIYRREKSLVEIFTSSSRSNELLVQSYDGSLLYSIFERSQIKFSIVKDSFSIANAPSQFPLELLFLALSSHEFKIDAVFKEKQVEDHLQHAHKLLEEGQDSLLNNDILALCFLDAFTKKNSTTIQKIISSPSFKKSHVGFANELILSNEELSSAMNLLQNFLKNKNFHNLARELIQTKLGVNSSLSLKFRLLILTFLIDDSAFVINMKRDYHKILIQLPIENFSQLMLGPYRNNNSEILSEMISFAESKRWPEESLGNLLVVKNKYHERVSFYSSLREIRKIVSAETQEGSNAASALALLHLRMHSIDEISFTEVKKIATHPSLRKFTSEIKGFLEKFKSRIKLTSYRDTFLLAAGFSQDKELINLLISLDPEPVSSRISFNLACSLFKKETSPLLIELLEKNRFTLSEPLILNLGFYAVCSLNKELLEIAFKSNSLTASIAKQIFDALGKRNKSEELEFFLHSPLGKMIKHQE